MSTIPRGGTVWGKARRSKVQVLREDLLVACSFLAQSARSLLILPGCVLTLRGWRMAAQGLRGSDESFKL